MLPKSYTEKQIKEAIKLYIEKSNKKGRSLYWEEFTKDPDLPTMGAMVNHGYTMSDLRKIAGYTRYVIESNGPNSIPSFCKDCAEEYEKCGKNIDNCKEEAEVYFRFHKEA